MSKICFISLLQSRDGADASAALGEDMSSQFAEVYIFFHDLPISDH